MDDALRLTRRGALAGAAAAGAGLMLGPSTGLAAPVAAVAAVASLPLATPVLDPGCGQPSIIARRAWAGDGHPPTHVPQYAAVQLAVVHHTLNADVYGPADVPALLRAIYAFHVHVRGWFDIGYNFLIDRYGRIWEGRAGGIAEPVIGAQAGDFNEISTGVALIGTFAEALPPPAAMRALERLLAWKLSLHGVPAIGEIATRAPAAEIAYTAFRPDQAVRFPRIAGHRQVDATDCPGGPVMRDLSALRHRVHAIAGRPPVLTLDGAAGQLASRPAITLAGRLSTHQDGPPLTGAQVALGVPGGDSPLARVTTDAGGRFEVRLTPRLDPRRELVVRAVHEQTPAAVSPLVAVLGVGSVDGLR